MSRVEEHLTELDRLEIRHRPDGQPLMHQTWGKLLFMHWRIDEKQLRPILPAKLEIDIFDGTAWIGIIPFTMWDIRAFPPFMPALPVLNAMHELNVRTYVHYDRVPGVWFFSLDCNSAAAVMAARTVYHLPYFNADIELEQESNTINYQLILFDGPATKFKCSFTIRKSIPVAQPEPTVLLVTWCDSDDR